jgi:hypothetical protein
MTWFKVDDGLYMHRKWRALSKGARALWTSAGSWCADQLTDGVVPRHIIKALDGTPREARQLVEAGLWEPNPEGWQFHEWHTDGDGSPRNPTREEVERDRAANRERQRRARDRSREARELLRESQQASRGPSPPGSRVTTSPPDPTRPYDSKGGDNSRAAADGPPPPRCPDHIDHQGPVPPCPACADARRASDAWQVRHGAVGSDRRLDHQQQAALDRAERHTRRRAIEPPIEVETDGKGPRNARDSLRKRA